MIFQNDYIESVGGEMISVDSLPKLLDCTESFKNCCDSELWQQLLPDTFTESFFFTGNQITIVYQIVVGHSNCNEWKKQRKDRTTATLNSKRYIHVLKII